MVSSIIIGLNKIYKDFVDSSLNQGVIHYINSNRTYLIESGFPVESLEDKCFSNQHNITGRYLCQSTYIYGSWERSIYNNISQDCYEAILSKKVRSAKNFLLKNNISAVVFCDIPHHINEIAWHLASDALQLRILVITSSYGGHNSALIDFSECLRRDNKSIEFVKPTPNISSVSSVINRPYWDWICGHDLNPPECFTINGFSRSEEYFYKKVKQTRYNWALSDKNSMVHEQAELKSKYIEFSKSSPPVNDKKSVVVMLHYEPEACVKPLGGIYGNQLLMMEAISNQLAGIDCQFLVKEHPATFTTGFVNDERHVRNTARKISDYHLMHHYGYRFISTNKSLRQLINEYNVKLVCTVTGTCILESIMLGVTSAAYGNSIYRLHDEVLGPDQVTKMKSLLNLPDEIKIKRSIETTIAQEHCFYFPFEVRPSYDAYTQEISPNQFRDYIMELVTFLSKLG